MMTRVVRRWRRASALGVGIFALTVGAAVVPAAPASAADREVTGADEEYYSYYKLASLHSQGYTGEGAIIAMIDGHGKQRRLELLHGFWARRPVGAAQREGLDAARHESMRIEGLFVEPELAGR